MISLISNYFKWLFNLTPKDVPKSSLSKLLTQEQLEKQELLCKKLQLKAGLEKLRQKNGNKSTSSKEVRST